MSSAVEILLVEDDENLGFLIKDSLDAHGWKVNLFADGEKGLSAFMSQPYDLCILDVMLPKKDGFDLAKNIRTFNQHVPIVFLTARGMTADRIRGFQVGADDYVTKPFSIEEFRYRLEAILKRTKQNNHAPDVILLKAGEAILDVQNLKLSLKGHSTQLTYKEGRLLEMFFRNQGKLIERDVFLKTIWEDDGFFVARSMDVFISRIRKLLADDPSLRIDNVRGIGYVLRLESSP